MKELFLNISNYLSLFLAVYSIFITIKYNNQSNKINKDNIALQNELNRRDNNYICALREINKKIDFIKNGNKDIVYLNKDIITLIKTSRFKHDNCDKAIKLVEELENLIKYKFIEDIKSFLKNSKKSKIELNLRRMLSKEDLKQVINISTELYDLGIQICIHYI